MNKHIEILKSKVQDTYIIGLLVAVFLISFFLGMEYKAYQFRSVMKDAFSGIQDAFSPLSNTTKKDDEKTISIAKWQSYDTQEWMKLSIRSVENIGKEFNEFPGIGMKAKNTFFKVLLQWENIGKAPGSQRLYGASLILADGTTYIGEEWQIANTPEGFGGCIACSMNPGDKAVEAVLFDINVANIDGAKLKVGNMLFDL